MSEEKKSNKSPKKHRKDSILLPCEAIKAGNVVVLNDSTTATVMSTDDVIKQITSDVSLGRVIVYRIDKGPFKGAVGYKMSEPGVRHEVIAGSGDHKPTLMTRIKWWFKHRKDTKKKNKSDEGDDE